MQRYEPIHGNTRSTAISHLFVDVSWIVVFGTATCDVHAASNALEDEVSKRAAAIESKLIAWRRDIHQHPELGDQETRTSALVAQHLRSIGLEVRTGIARTGAVGILKGAKAGSTVALRAEAPLAGASEDFSFFAKGTPALYVFLGIMPRNQDPAKAPPNHNPRFFVDESALVVGVRTLGFLAVNFLTAPAKAEPPRRAQPFVQENH